MNTSMLESTAVNSDGRETGPAGHLSGQRQVPDGSWGGAFRQIWGWLKQHFAHRPLTPHLMVWLMVGILLGIVLAPDQQTASILAFVIAGTIVAVGLGIATYPLSDHHNLTFTGALTGLAITPVLTVLGIGLTQMAAPMFLIIGALTGGTCLVWMGPARFILQKMPGLFQ